MLSNPSTTELHSPNVFCSFFTSFMSHIFFNFLIHFTYQPQFSLTSLLLLPPVLPTNQLPSTPSMGSLQSLVQSVKAGPGHSPLHQGWERYPTIGNVLPKASSCTGDRSQSHCQGCLKQTKLYQVSPKCRWPSLVPCRLHSCPSRVHELGSVLCRFLLIDLDSLCSYHPSFLSSTALPELSLVLGCGPQHLLPTALSSSG